VYAFWEKYQKEEQPETWISLAREARFLWKRASPTLSRRIKEVYYSIPRMDNAIGLLRQAPQWMGGLGDRTYDPQLRRIVRLIFNSRKLKHFGTLERLRAIGTSQSDDIIAKTRACAIK